MKQVKILLTILLASAFLSACKEEVDVDTMYTHALRVTFVDESGENPIPLLECYEDPYQIKYPMVQYSPDWENKVLEKYFTFNMSDEEGGYIYDRLVYRWFYGIAYLDFTFTLLYRWTSMANMELSCETIFGDNEIHYMTAEYNIGNFNNQGEFECVRFTLDGVEYPVKAGGLVTVPLGR